MGSLFASVFLLLASTAAFAAAPQLRLAYARLEAMEARMAQRAARAAQDGPDMSPVHEHDDPPRGRPPAPGAILRTLLLAACLLLVWAAIVSA